MVDPALSSAAVYALIAPVQYSAGDTESKVIPMAAGAENLKTFEVVDEVVSKIDHKLTKSKTAKATATAYGKRNLKMVGATGFALW